MKKDAEQLAQEKLKIQQQIDIENQILEKEKEK